MTLLELTKRREKTKREFLHLSIEVFEKRYQVKDFNGHMLNEYTATAAKTARYNFSINIFVFELFFLVNYVIFILLYTKADQLLRQFMSINTHMHRQLRLMMLVNRLHHNGLVIIINFRRINIIPPPVQRYQAQQ